MALAKFYTPQRQPTVTFTPIRVVAEVLLSHSDDFSSTTRRLFIDTNDANI